MAVALVGCGKKEEETSQKSELPKAVPEKLISNPIVEKAIRRVLKKPTGELTKADLEKVTGLDLESNKLTDVKGLEKLTQLTELSLYDNPDLTEAQIAELHKALPRCVITW
jgi:Leucine-rich repeat (LRR) protein